jgi:aryl-alcohol dehydrogenase-like predicted oxidoreductase
MIPRITIAPAYDISRIIKGGWHLAGDHGPIDPDQALRDMAAFVEAGITTMDCADIYAGVESRIGEFRIAYTELSKRIQIHTKFVPDLPDLAVVDRAYVERIIDRSLSRLGMERLDMVQFHWWDFAVPGYVEAAQELDRLRRVGKIAHVSVTNFSVPRLQELISAGIPICTHQLQYSLLDDRPRHGMADFCAAHSMSLLCYGTVAGGFLSERWLGAPEPHAPLANRSLVKYKLIIDDFGGWALFQTLLKTLAGIAHAHHTDIATIATQAILQRPTVAAAIVGATNASHLGAHAQLADVVLDDAEITAIDAVCSARQGPLGDVYDLERDRNGRHGRIMKYELNAAP